MSLHRTRFHGGANVNFHTLRTHWLGLLFATCFSSTSALRRRPSLSCGGVCGLRSAAFTPLSCFFNLSLRRAIAFLSSFFLGVLAEPFGGGSSPSQEAQMGRR